MSFQNMCSDIVLKPMCPDIYSPIDRIGNTWELGDVKFIFSCTISISHSFAALTRDISS